MAWVKPESGTGTNFCLFMQGPNSEYSGGNDQKYFSLCVMSSSGYLGYNIWGLHSDRYVTDSGTSTRVDAAARGDFPDGEWHHLAFTWSGDPDNMVKVRARQSRSGDPYDCPHTDLR